MALWGSTATDSHFTGLFHVPPLLAAAVEVKFVGLYDTVASHGLKLSLAENVVQLAAAEEHRANFRLTYILPLQKAHLEVFRRY